MAAQFRKILPHYWSRIMALSVRGIPVHFHWSRSLVIARVYIERMWHDLPVSLTLGGVLLIPVGELLALGAGSSVCVVLGAVLAVPLRSAWVLTAEERARLLRRLGAKAIGQQTLLFYIAFHVHHAFRRSLDSARRQRAGRGPRERKPPRFEYPRLISEALFPVLNFRSAEALLSYLRFNPEHFWGELDAFVEARSAAERASATLPRDNRERMRAEERAGKAEARVEKLETEFRVGGAPQLLWEGYRVVAQPGTRATLLELETALKQHPDPAERGQLLALVDEARAHSLIDLAGLGGWADDGCKDEVPKTGPTLTPDALVDVAREFASLVDNLAPGQRLRVVTAGYSSVVLQCLEEVGAARIKRVSIVETDPYHERDNRLMSARLEQIGIRTHIIGKEEFDRQTKRQTPPGGFEVAVFGFEVISPTGDVLHPRSTPHPLGLLASPGNTLPMVVAVGEQWKVRDLDVDIHNPAFVAVYGFEGLTHVVTEHRSHDVSPQHGAGGQITENLDCCVTRT